MPEPDALSPRPARTLARRAFLLTPLAALALVVLADVALVEAKDSARPIIGQEWPASANHAQRPQANNSPVLAIDPTEPRFVALAHRVDGPKFSCALQVSGDGGRGWVRAIPVAKLPPGADTCYNPQVAFDRDGTLFYLFVGLHGSGNQPMGAFVASSTDRAKSFTPPRRVLGPLKFQVNMAIDRELGKSGRIHLVWLDANSDPGLGAMPPGPNPILASYSDNGGRSFSKPVRISDDRRMRVVAPSLALGPNHAVSVLYYDLQDDDRDYLGLEGPVWEGKWSLVFSTSSDGGKRFSSGAVVDNSITPPERVMLIFTMPPPSLAVDKQGTLVAAWHDGRNGDWDAFVSRSADKGRSWQKPLRLNDDPRGEGAHQYQPRLSISSSGRVDAIFYDRRDDRQNLLNHVYYSYSKDGAQSFSPNLRLTTKASDSRVGQSYKGPAAKGLIEFGSRIGLVSGDSSALAAWTDTRHVRSAAEGGMSLRQDVFTAIIAQSKSSKTATSGRVVAGVVVAAGILTAALLKRRSRRLKMKTVEGQ